MSQIRVVASLALLYMLRMLGLFMVLPVLILYGDHYEGATIALLGLALGIYGLSQAALQIPLGMLSDRIGRKPVILIGLVLFALGSLVAAWSTSIEGLIAGRILQGTGAIAGAIMAMVTDLTTEEFRTRAMAFIGASIGVSFALALVLGPAIAGIGGIQGVFLVTAALAVLGMGVLMVFVPDPPNKSARPVSERAASLPDVLKNTQLLRLNWGIFSLHAILMASFVVVPLVLETRLGFARDLHWLVYSLILFGAFVFMLPIVASVERRGRNAGPEAAENTLLKRMLLWAIACLALSLALLALFVSSTYVKPALFMLFTFFVAFNLLEASLPSLVSKLAPAASKGTALGVYSTSQFAGIFLGGMFGGAVSELWGSSAVFVMCALVALIWFFIALGMKIILPKSAESVASERA